MSGKTVVTNMPTKGLENKDAVTKSTNPHKEKQRPWDKITGTDIYGYDFDSTKAAFLELRKSLLIKEMNIKGSKADYDGNKMYNEDLELLCDGDSRDRKLLNDEIFQLQNRIMFAAGVNRSLKDKIVRSEISFYMETRLNDELKKSKKNLERKSLRVKLPSIKSLRQLTFNVNHHKLGLGTKYGMKLPAI